MARKVWVLDTETKGTGANVVPLEKVLGKPEPKRVAPPPRPRQATEKPRPTRPGAPAAEPVRSASPLPPGHVRKKATGELGRVQELDSKAGTATVFWLKQGRASTVPLSAISRR
jgi:hypothetical protein